MKFAISAALSCLLCVAAIAAPALFNPTSEVISQSASGVTIAVEIPEPSLSVLNRGDYGNAISVEIAGAIPNFDLPGVVLPTITKLLVVPDGYRAVTRIKNVQSRDFSIDAMVPHDEMERVLRGTSQPPVIEVGEAGWMRWLRVAPVVIHPARYDAQTRSIQVAQRVELEFDFVPDGSFSGRNPDPERYWSMDYAAFFDQMLLNPDPPRYIAPGGRVVKRGTYLILTDDTLDYWTPEFANWKRAKGYNVVVAPIYYRGISADEIRAYIRDAYENWERPPEYVLILGDANSGIEFPAFQITNPGTQESNPTDLPYSLMQDEDYFPDLFVGRVSSDSPTSAIAKNYFARIIRHERNPLSFPAANFNRAVVFACNRGDGNDPVLSPVETAEWLAQRLRENGMDVYTQMWRGAGDDDTPGPIVEAINRGCNIVAYRGWADSRGTHYPRFYIEDLGQLNNGPLLPVMTFFVCNTGDYDNQDRALCFGEVAISGGSRLNPTGAINFFGPSDLHTKTTFNNSMLAGYYHGLIYQGLRVMSQLCLQAKMTVWATNPHLRIKGGNESNYVEFYFSVYNILGDPEGTVYFKRPRQLSVTAPQTLAVGQNQARFVVRDAAGDPIYGALINLKKGDETEVSIMTDEHGLALAPVVLNTPDTLYATTLAYDCAPVELKIPVTAEQRMIGFDGVTVHNELGDDRLISGSPVELTVNLKNFGANAAASVSATLSTPLEGIEILNAQSAFGNIAPGASAASQTAFRVNISPAFDHNSSIAFNLAIRDNQGDLPEALFRVTMVNGMVSLRGFEFESEILEPGATENLVLSVNNWSVLPVEGLHATLSAFDEAIEIVDGEASFGDIAAESNGTCADDPFRIHIRDGVVIGRQVALRVSFFDSDDVNIENAYFSFIVGNPGPTDPVGPDGYGYFAYDNVDTDYDPHPSYEWIELDPAFGGANATLQEISDDETFIIDLPFNFRYYGNNYRSLSVCSNGWASFERTTVWDFNNWPIRSPLGPHTMLCPFWEDLVGHDPGNGVRQNMKIFYRYDEDDHRFIVEWSRVFARSGNDVENTETFEIVLFDPEFHQTPTGDGKILFQYEEVRIVDRIKIPYDYATIGIQDWFHLRGIELSFAGFVNPSTAEFEGGRAILFTTEPPDEFLGSGENPPVLPAEFRLGEPFPNPFNSRTAVDFDLPRAGELKAGIYDLSGRFLLQAGAGYYQAGSHKLEFDAAELPSGIYMLRVEAAGEVGQRKLTLLK